MFIGFYCHLGIWISEAMRRCAYEETFGRHIVAVVAVVVVVVVVVVVNHNQR